MMMFGDMGEGGTDECKNIFACSDKPPSSIGLDIVSKVAFGVAVLPTTDRRLDVVPFPVNDESCSTAVSPPPPPIVKPLSRVSSPSYVIGPRSLLDISLELKKAV
jgi:hypothetical protein